MTRPSHGNVNPCALSILGKNPGQKFFAWNALISSVSSPSPISFKYHKASLWSESRQKEQAGAKPVDPWHPRVDGVGGWSCSLRGRKGRQHFLGHLLDPELLGCFEYMRKLLYFGTFWIIEI